MAKLSKEAKLIRSKVERTKQYSIAEAVALLKELGVTKFNESIDVSVNLGVDPRKSDQNVRGATVSPNGTGKTVPVAYSPKALMQTRLKRRARILSEWTILENKSKKVN